MAPASKIMYLFSVVVDISGVIYKPVEVTESNCFTQAVKIMNPVSIEASAPVTKTARAAFIHRIHMTHK